MKTTMPNLFSNSQNVLSFEAKNVSPVAGTSSEFWPGNRAINIGLKTIVVNCCVRAGGKAVKKAAWR